MFFHLIFTTSPVTKRDCLLSLTHGSFYFMVTLLTIQVLSILGTALTNLVGILAFATDNWSIVIYDVLKLRSHTKWLVVENTTNNNVQIIDVTNDRNQTSIFLFNDQQLMNVAIGIKNDTILYQTHKGIFRQCNYLSENVREHLKISTCRLLKVANTQYDDATHGMNNPGRELIRKYFQFGPRNSRPTI